MRNDNMYSEALIMASEVDFLESMEEIKMYADAIYEAMKWGMKESEKVQKSD